MEAARRGLSLAAINGEPTAERSLAEVQRMLHSAQRRIRGECSNGRHWR